MAIKPKKAKPKAKKQTRKPRGKLADIQLPATTERISFSPGGRPRKFSNDDELRKQIEEYFKYQEERKRPVLWIGIAVWLGMHRDTLNQYESGVYDSKENRFSDTLREAKGFVENDKLENGLLGNYNSHMAKFDLANNHGYAEKQDVNAKVQEKQIDPDKDFDSPETSVKAYQEFIKRNRK